MKKLLKGLLITVLAAALILCNGCSLFAEKEKTFTFENLKITLTNRFFEDEMEPFSVVYDSSKIAVFVLKEAFEGDLNGDLTLTEYAEMVIEANDLPNAEIETENGLTAFYYERSGDGGTYAYYAAVYESSDAFWLIQFATEQDEYEKYEENIFTYAQSVTFSEA